MAKYIKETDELFQYSQGFRLIVPNAYKNCHTQFYSEDYPDGLAIAPSSYEVIGGKTYCPVPNQMTVHPNTIIVFAYLLEEDRAITESKTTLAVRERPKPPDFVFDPTDTVTYATATELISDMEATLGKFTNVSASASDGESAQAKAEISETGLEFTFVLPKGDKGDTGVSIATVLFKEYDDEGGAVYTITMDDGSTTTFTAPKGSQGDKGNTGDTGATISSVTFKEYDSNGGAVYTITMTDGATAEFTAPKGQKGDKGDIGDTGATGNGIKSITLVSGSHAAGTVDTYRITFTNGETTDFTVYNGANGEGAGDMLWEEFNNRLNPANKSGQIALESELPTSEQKAAWNAKYAKPSTGIPKTDLASDVQSSLAKADSALQEHQDISALVSHTNNSDIHVTADNKSAWSAKYNKPSSGIPSSDLSSDVQNSLIKANTALQQHQDISGKANKSTTLSLTMTSSGWEGSEYSFEDTYPSDTYDITIELNGDTATAEQVDAWSGAKITGSLSNKCIAKGDVPTIDIPIILKAEAIVDINASSLSLDDIEIVSWSDGTDAQIATMVQAADEGLINLSDYWSVGDERQVTLSAMDATGVNESHAEQTVTMVLMQAGLYKLANGNTCNFIVGQKNGLAEKGHLNPTETNECGWHGSARRTWCNNVYRNAMPSELKPIFKKFRTISAETNSGDALKISEDYFALPAEKEVRGIKGYSTEIEANALTQFAYYAAESNRIKRLGNDGDAYHWWSRSLVRNNSSYFSFITSGGASEFMYLPNFNSMIAPFGCI